MENDRLKVQPAHTLIYDFRQLEKKMPHTGCGNQDYFSGIQTRIQNPPAAGQVRGAKLYQ
jgi:hypothetical protein